MWTLFWNALIKPRRSQRRHLEPPPPWLDKRFARDSGLLGRRQELTQPLDGICDPYMRQYCQHLVATRDALESTLQYETSSHIAEARYPYTHLPLISFMASIPPDQIWRPHDRRSIMRRALRGILPEAIRTRRCKSGLGGTLTAGVETNWAWVKHLIESSRLIRLGYVVRRDLLDAFQKARCGLGVPSMPALLRFMAVEVWLNNLAAMNV